VSEEARPFVDFCHSNYSSHCCQSSTVANAATKALATEAATEVIIITVASIATKALVKISYFIFQHHRLKLTLFKTLSKS
jgi:hypothetical protein